VFSTGEDEDDVLVKQPNQTELAILGGLSIEPMTGYALRENIRNVLGHFWSESYGQIYPTLTELERNGSWSC
jgi:DNA-binding PadR family transcriptional regulator